VGGGSISIASDMNTSPRSGELGRDSTYKIPLGTEFLPGRRGATVQPGAQPSGGW
jgi:hypothetical protein